MYNKYVIELSEDKTQVKATIYLGGASLGTVWTPHNQLETKQDFVDLFTSVGSVIYGQEAKAKKKEESDIQILKALENQSRAEQKEVQ